MKAYVGELDYEAAARVRWYGRHTQDWESLNSREKVMWITATKALVDTALASMTQIEVTQIHGGFTDTEEHEFTQWISEWVKEKESKAT
ncbi:hypothetical protein LCGC14_1379330 [marine sediment metagenome]|uniref:Uncharacterized protein n=1 Tax=marine sediment metagenome TaxID=412755 RepID=A0A0F9N4T0_9ZZZZ